MIKYCSAAEMACMAYKTLILQMNEHICFIQTPSKCPIITIFDFQFHSFQRNEKM